MNVCGLISKLRNPDFINFLALYHIVCPTETKLDQYDDVSLDGYKLLPLVNRLNCKSKSGGICVFVRDKLYKYVHVDDTFSSPSRCVFWFSVDSQLYLLFTKTLFGVVYIPPENSLYSNIEMFSEIENFLLNIDCDYCLLGDFNSHTGNVKEYTEIDGNILDFCHVPDEERLLLNNLHILDECNVPYLRYSQDKHRIDKYGQMLLDLCKSLGLFFVN